MDASGNNITTLGLGFSTPSGVAVGSSGNIYVADAGNNAIKKISWGATVNALALDSLVTAPVKGATPGTTAIDQTQYTGTVAWYESDGTTPVTGNFAASTVYKAKVTLTAKAGYTLTGVAQNSFTYTGATSAANAADSGTVTITFPATVALFHSGGDGGSYSPAPAPTTVTGSIIDGTTGAKISNITATVTTDSHGNATISMKAAQTVMLKQPDGSTSPLGDVSKVAITTAAGAPVTISADGTIQVTNLAKGTDNHFNITYDLGNGQTITLGTMKIKIGSNGDVTVTTTLIDPYGIIIDAATGKILEGVNVTLYYANTDRNKAAGKTPDTVVSLPGIDGFKPNNNKIDWEIGSV